jgi:hypothetical protein
MNTSIDPNDINSLTTDQLKELITQAQSILDIKTKQYEVKVSWNGIIHLYSINRTDFYFTYAIFNKETYVIPYLYDDCTMRYCDPIKVKSTTDNNCRPITLIAVLENVPELNGIEYRGEANVKKYFIKKKPR